MNSPLTMHEVTLTAAQQLLRTGPFWLLDLWESLSLPLQQEIVETLCSSTSFTAALEAAGFVEDDLGLDDDDDDEDEDDAGPRNTKVVHINAIRSKPGGKA